MALRPSDLGRRKNTFVEDDRPLPTDDEIAGHLGINPDVFRIPHERNKPSSPTKPEGPKQPGEGSV